jgi:RimJ/RimL family protein N-acetyltransferase
MERNKYELTTERLGLRTWLPKDVIPFAEMNADAEVMRFFPHPLSRQETERFLSTIEQHFHERGFGLFAVDELSTGEFIGFIGFSTATFKSSFTPCVEVGWRLRRKSWGYGYATEGAIACLRRGFQQHGLADICSFTSAINLRSVAVMKRIGLKYRMDFDHPKIDSTSELCRHVLYGIAKTGFDR